jgi:rod shape-determining protein MreD
MAGYVGLAVAVVGALLQSTVLAEQQVLGLHVDVVPLAVIGWSALRRFEDGLLWAGLGGLSMDLFSGGPPGTSIASLAIAALVATSIGSSMRAIHQFLVVVAVPVGVLTYYLTAALLMALGGMAVDPLDLIRGVIGPALVISLAASPVAMLLLGWLSRRTTRPPWTPH